MTRETIARHRLEACRMIAAMSRDGQLRKVYSDFDFYGFVSRCEMMLEEFDDGWKAASPAAPFMKGASK